VARAYVDQLRRDGGAAAPAEATLDEIAAALDVADARLAARGRDGVLAARLAALAGGLAGGLPGGSAAGGGDAIAQKRTQGLAATLTALAARLR
jgi:hypothetical protein